MTVCPGPVGHDGGDWHVSYRDFACPLFFHDSHTTDEWLAWMEQHEDVLLPVSRRHDHSCADCYGASGYIGEGPDTWNRCMNCRGYGDAIDVFVPMTYSIDAGLESMLHRYKDFDGYDWLRYALGALVNDFVEHHGACLDRETPSGRFDIATTIPPNDTRDFDHLQRLLSGVVEDDVFTRWNWTSTSFAATSPSRCRVVAN